MKFDPFSVPAGVTNHDLWLHGLSDEPAVGDLWLLSWESEGLGLLVVTGIAETYVLGWPATLPLEPSYAPALRVESPLGCEVAVWPTRETGVGLHLLHHSFGQVIEPPLIREIWDAVEDDQEPPIPFAPAAPSLEEAVAQGEQMLVEWESICFNQWPEQVPGQTPLNQQVLRDLSIKPSHLAEALGIEAVEASALHKGTMIPRAEQLSYLADRMGIDADVLVSLGLDEGTRLLSHPIWKSSVLETSRDRDVSESEARRKIQDQYALAARSNGKPEDRMLAAITRVRTE